MSGNAPQFGYGLRDGMSKALENYDAPGPDYEVGSGYGRQQKDFPDVIVPRGKPFRFLWSWIVFVVSAIAILALLAVQFEMWWVALLLALWMLLSIKGDKLIALLIFIGGPVFLLLAILAM